MHKNERQEQARPDVGQHRLGVAERDFVALGITAAAIILFVGIGGPVIAETLGALGGLDIRPDSFAVSALLLNIALIIFSWRRYRQLQDEVRQRRMAEEHARKLAATDPLTGCLNRRSQTIAAAELAASAREKGQILAFLAIDLDNFKQVNDFHGHTAGDDLLREIAIRIGKAMPEGSLIARMGGDEFVCALAIDPARSDRIDAIAATLIEEIARSVEINGIKAHVSASLGLASSATAPRGEIAQYDPQALLHMADIAMYHAKRQGKNRYAWFEASMECELRFRGELEQGIREGLIAGEFVPYYEQQINLVTGELTGFEMLARWQSSSLGLVSPEIFIPVAEEIGLISQMSECLIAQALRDAKTWDQRLTLSVNISPIQLRDPWFAQKLLKLLVAENFPPNRLEIEITETCLHDNVGVVRTLITSLKNQGIQVSLDDFGTGYSSLAQLRSLPFDRIKIDRSFVTNMVENSDSATIVSAINALGKGLGLPVTVEGIETEQVLQRLRDMGELKGQGYLYGKPESAAATEERLADMNLLARPNGAPENCGVDVDMAMPHRSSRSGG